MNPPPFLTHSACEACPLHAQATFRGIPARPADFTAPGRYPRALLVVGEAPGFHEDRTNKCWVGQTGQLLHRMLEVSSISSLADVYLSNACRCRPPQNATPSDSNIHRCHDHLLDDIHLLLSAYGDDLTILCAGASACKSILDTSLSKAFANHQGRKVLLARLSEESVPIPVPVPVFVTYHPAIVLGKRPALINTIRDHLLLLARHLSRVVPRTQEHNQATLLAAEPPPFEPDEGILSLDIETYGVMEGPDQTCFHPVKMHLVDGIPPDKQVITAALSWEHGGVEQSAAFVLTHPTHLQRFVRFLRWAHSYRLTVLGQNILFDLAVLRAFNPIIRNLLKPFCLRLEDVMLWNFLHSENRPERSLKSLAKLFSLSEYTTTAKDLRCTDPFDPTLLQYNVLDTLTALRARRLLIDAIGNDYYLDNSKLSIECRNHCSDLLWTTLRMTEAGVPFDTIRLSHVHHMHERAYVAALAVSTKRSLTFHGKGSKKSIDALMQSYADTLIPPGRVDANRIELTEKRRELSTGEKNINLFLDALKTEPRTVRRPLELLASYRYHQKIVSTYSGPLLTDPRVGLTADVPLRPGVKIAYPSWFPCPTRYEQQNQDASEGGTIQARITCKHPALQTNPPDIQACETTRFPGGVLLSIDLSQIELRVAALLSGDPIMLGEYARNEDRHAITGATIYAICLPDADPWLSLPRTDKTRKLFRQIGKTTNFLITFEGQASKLVATVQADTGYVITLSQAQRIIDEFNARYVVLRRWQSSLIDEAVRIGYIVLPTGWSRMFPGGRKAVENEKSTVLNFPIQATAAQLLQSSQAAIERELVSGGFRSVIQMNVHDALHIDCPAIESEIVRKLCGKHLTNPPYLRTLEKRLGRTVPIEYETTVISTGSNNIVPTSQDGNSLNTQKADGAV